MIYYKKFSLIDRIFQLILIALISSLSGVASSAFTQEITYTDSDSNFYTTVAADYTTKLGSDSSDIIVAAGATAKVKFIIPPGTDQFYVNGQEVTSWSGHQGDIRYAASLTDYASADAYNLVTSTGFSMIFLYSESGQGALTTSISSIARYGYFIIKNTSAITWKSFYINVQMRVSHSAVYNDWVNNGRAPPDLLLAPTSLSSGAITKDSITLNWINTVANAEYNLIKRNDVIIAGLPPTAISFTDNTGLNAVTDYFYQICAYNDYGEACSDYFSVKTRPAQQSVDLMAIYFLLY